MPSRIWSVQPCAASSNPRAAAGRFPPAADIHRFDEVKEVKEVKKAKDKAMRRQARLVRVRILYILYLIYFLYLQLRTQIFIWSESCPSRLRLRR